MIFKILVEGDNRDYLTNFSTIWAKFGLVFGRKDWAWTVELYRLRNTCFLFEMHCGNTTKGHSGYSLLIGVVGIITAININRYSQHWQVADTSNTPLQDEI